jgi:hypothetical protein
MISISALSIQDKQLLADANQYKVFCYLGWYS